VPNHPIAFLNFVNRIHDTHSEASNIVVHCHNGAGRSGMFVAIDSLLYEGQVTRKLDVVNAVTVLRMERPNMVHTKRQYQFVYEVLCEAFHHRSTRLEASKFEFTYENMLSISNDHCRSLIAAEYDSIISNKNDKSLEKSMKWTEFSLYVSPCKKDLNISKAIPNQSILHGYPMPLVIAHLDSHLSVDKFVITLYPNNEKTFEFWEMVFDINTAAVVMINDTELHRPPYWPAQGDAKLGDNCSVWTTNTLCDVTNAYYVRNLEVRKGLSKSSPVKHVKHFQFIAWPSCKEAPPVRHTVNFIQQLRSWYYRSGLKGPLVVHSANGISRASLFCVLWSILERLDEERTVDVYRTTRYTQAVVSAAVTSVVSYQIFN
jgi:protein tyrosine phosphatase